jgi:Gpi18-like mannosyltransferase
MDGRGDQSTGTVSRVPLVRSADADEVLDGKTPRWNWQRDAGVPLLIYAATRLAQLLVLTWMDPVRGPSIQSKLLSWDAGWFINVAQNGYPHGYSYAGGHVTGNGLAFFPLYPLLIRGGHTLGLSYGAAALTISWIAGAVAAVLLYALARTLAGAGHFGERARASAGAVGYALVALFCAQPMSIVLSMGYTESLFVALVAGCFLAAHRHAWITAGLLGVAAGLTRPTGAALAVALGVAAAIRVAEHGTSRRERVSAIGAGVAALVSVPAYILWVGLRVGDPRAWFTIQTAGWGSTFDYGASTVSFVRSTLQSNDGWVAMSVVLILAAATVALVVALTHRGWLPLTLYGLIAFILVVGQAGFFHSKPRLLVPVLILFVPAALAAGRARPRNAVLWLTAYALFGIWYGAYMITVWPYAI